MLTESSAGRHRTHRAAGACLTLLAIATTGVTTNQTWRGIALAPESRCSPYDSADYSYPQSLELEVATRQGGLYSPYTGEWFENPTKSDIEHVVARSEAHDSGMCSRSPAARQRFAEDVENLTLADPTLNRNEKRGRDAAEWQPARNRCWFAATVIHVRRKYDLTIDPREAEALDRLLAECP